ncbi:MAG: arsenate reductase ArsC [Bacteroidetes bacterium]|nr:arsenate reductase ArsC [Bacteroidota bacterium]
MKRVLVLCTGNSCRSQMAEGYLRFYSNGNIEVSSAGLKGTTLNPYTIRVMEEDNIDMSKQEPQGVEEFAGEAFDYLITVCEEADETALSGIHYRHKAHFNIPDPALKQGTDEEIEEEFLRVREIIKKNMLKFLGGILSEDHQSV